MSFVTFGVIEVALKEWQVVCDLLAGGSQTLLLRKGGIQEGPDGFSISHHRFALLPTRLHQKAEMLKPPFRTLADGGDVEPESFELTHGGEVSDVLVVPSREALDRLNDLHAWDEPYLEMRWNYRPERPLFLVIVRAFKLATATTLKNTYRVAGCKSWVPLEEAGPVEFGEPALGDEAFGALRERVSLSLAG